MKKLNLLKTVRMTIISILIMVMAVIVLPEKTSAKVLDEILDYEMTVDVNDDASVEIVYDISWKVLDSKTEGPLEWVEIGIPNKHCDSIEGLSDTIRSVSTKTSGESYAVVYFDRKYYEGEVVNFSFKITQNYMYQYYPAESISEYTFTPGWFDNITVDNLVIRWNSDKAERFSPACSMEGDYMVWQTSLNPGGKYTVTVGYTSDAYAFDTTVHENESSSYEFSEHSLIENILFTLLIIVFMVVIVAACAAPFGIPILLVFLIYKASRGFTAGGRKEYTRTIVEYYPSCPNCGGTREEGKEKCSYCGTNMVKSTQVVKESDLPKDDKILSYKKDGEFRYSDDPNKYVRVHVVTIPYTPPVRSSSRSGGSHHSSCAHSSCACACACACAGGGRAGCSTKDFYRTDLRLSHIKKHCKK